MVEQKKRSKNTLNACGPEKTYDSVSLAKFWQVLESTNIISKLLKQSKLCSSNLLKK